MDAILSVVRMNVARKKKENSLDAIASKMTITAFFKAKINFGKIGSFPIKTFFQTHPKYNDDKIL